MHETADSHGFQNPRVDGEANLGRVMSWTGEIAKARARTARLREISLGDAPVDGRTVRFVQELQLTYEELSVAEEELRTQNEQLLAAHAAIDAERARYLELFQLAPIPYLVTDAAGTIRSANLAASRLVRCPLEFLAGKPLVVFTRDTSRRRIRTALRSLPTADGPVTFRVNLTTRRMSVVRVEATASVNRDARGNIQEVRWLLVDQRPRRRLERARRARAAELEALVAERTAELERSQRLKEQLIATVSHELRTPLSAIAGYTELLTLGVRGPISDGQREDLERIHRAYEHMARVVDDLLNYSKLAAGQMPLDIQDAVVRDELRVVAELITPQAGERGVALTVAEAPAGMIVRADPERLRQIVLNLISNAVKFTPSGGWVTVRPDATDGHAVIEVQDNGRGIPRDKRESIFEPFVRLSRDRSTPGTGLGLAISREMARAMGGDLTVSDVDRGSCFALRLPLSTRLAGPSPG